MQQARWKGLKFIVDLKDKPCLMRNLIVSRRELATKVNKGDNFKSLAWKSKNLRSIL